MKRTHIAVFVSLAVVVALAFPASANDTRAEWAVGGIVFKEEAHISLAREDLTIGPGSVTVQYQFRNDTDTPVEATVAFPMPEYSYNPVLRLPAFDDFTVEVDGVPVAYKKQVRATVNGKDYAALLESNGVTPENFGGVFGPDMDETLLLKKLSPEKVDLFTRLGLLNAEMAGWPEWTVSKTYYWPQKFPARAVTTIKHKYTPYEGGDFQYVSYPDCRAEAVDEWIRNDPKKRAPVHDWIHYVLTTANNWRGPIGEFHLKVENPRNDFVVVCFDRELATQDSESLMDFKDFSPSQDLKVHYYSLTDMYGVFEPPAR